MSTRTETPPRLPSRTLRGALVSVFEAGGLHEHLSSPQGKLDAVEHLEAIYRTNVTLQRSLRYPVVFFGNGASSTMAEAVSSHTSGRKPVLVVGRLSSVTGGGSGDQTRRVRLKGMRDGDYLAVNLEQWQQAGGPDRAQWFDQGAMTEQMVVCAVRGTASRLKVTHLKLLRFDAWGIPYLDSYYEPAVALALRNLGVRFRKVCHEDFDLGRRTARPDFVAVGQGGQLVFVEVDPGGIRGKDHKIEKAEDYVGANIAFVSLQLQPEHLEHGGVGKIEAKLRGLLLPRLC